MQPAQQQHQKAVPIPVWHNHGNPLQRLTIQRSPATPILQVRITGRYVILCGRVGNVDWHEICGHQRWFYGATRWRIEQQQAIIANGNRLNTELLEHCIASTNIGTNGERWTECKFHAIDVANELMLLQLNVPNTSVSIHRNCRGTQLPLNR